MANFNLPFGVRVSNNNPLDAERYVVADITTRDALLGTPIRAYEGLQVYVESEKNLYILKDVDLSIWELVGGGLSYLSTLLDVSIGSDVSSGFVLVFDPCANDPSKWWAVKPVDAANLFVMESSLGTDFQWSGGLLEVVGGGGGGDVMWSSGNVGTNNQVLTANGDGSIVAETNLVWTGTQLGVGTTSLNPSRVITMNGGFEASGNCDVVGDVSISSDLFINGMDSLASSNIVYVQPDGKLTYSQNNFAIDSSILWKVDASLIMPRNIDHDVQLNSIQIETDAGAVSIMDMDVSLAISGTEESYAFNLNGIPFLKIYGQSNGAGDVIHPQVISEVPLVTKGTEFIGLGDPCTNGSWRFVISGGNLSIQKLVSDVWVEKTLIV